MKNVIFDLGGVVIDWNPQKLVKEFTGDPKLVEYLFHKGFFQQYWTEFDRGMLTYEELVDEMVTFTGFSQEACLHFVEFIKNSLVDIPKTVELIKELSGRGYKLYCLSNMSVEFYDYLKVREVFNYFDGQVISGLEKLVKPDEAIYNVLLNRYQLVPEDSLFIDDLEANVQAARALGINAVDFSDRERGYAEIEEIIKGL